MIKFRRTEPEDLLTISGWIARDPDHFGINASFFVGVGEADGRHYSCYTVEDEEGPVIFVRQEVEGGDTRLHTQFPPVSGKRIVRALTDAYPCVAAEAKERGFKRIWFESGSIALVKFMFKFGFRADLVAEL